MTDALGKISFLDTPDVNGFSLMTNAGGVPSIQSGTSLPTAGTTGRLFLDSAALTFYRDNGLTWDSVSQSVNITGTANQINVTSGSNPIISLSSNPVLPGTAAFSKPSGTTVQRSGTPVLGDERFNSTLGYTEVYESSAWIPQGRIIQVVTGSIPASSGTVTIPLDNTVPVSNEGNQIWSQSFTPLVLTSRIIIRFSITTSASNTSRTIILALFAGSVNICSMMQTTPATANVGVNMTMDAAYSPASTATIIFSARLGAATSATTYCNQTSGATLGGSMVTEYTIMEVL